MLKQIWNDFKKRVLCDNRGIWPALAFLTNPAFWKGLGAVAGGLGSLGKGGGEGSTSAGGIVNQQQQQKVPINLMGFPSMANTNYGEIIKQMLLKQKLLT